MIALYGNKINTQSKTTSMSNFSSPFQSELDDPYQVRLTFEKLPIVPFQGSSSSSSDTVLELMYKLSEVTPVFSAAIDVLKSFGIGAGWELKKRKGLGIINKDLEDVSSSTIQSFEQKYIDNLIDTDLTDLSEYSVKSLSIDGNAGFLISIDKLSKKSKIEFIPTRKYRYWNKILQDGTKVIVISNSFTYDFLKSKPPIFVPVYPNFAENEEGLIQSFVHVKNSVPNRQFYGLSSAASSLLHQYSYNQMLVYLSAEIENRFTGKVMIDSEVEGYDLDSDISNSHLDFQNSLKNTFTNKGNQRDSVVTRFRSQGMQPSTVTQFKANTEHDFYDTVNNMFQDAILGSMGVDKRLIGDTSEASMFGENMEAIYMGMSQKVKSTQKLIENGINTCFEFIESQTGVDIREGSILKLKSVYAEMMKEKEVKELELISKQNDENQTDTNDK